MRNKFLNLDSLKFYFILFFITLLSVNSIHAQGTIEISGTVMDAKDKLPIVLANVMQKGKSNGTNTDLDGNFTIKVSDEKAILIVSYVGYKTLEVSVTGKTKLTINLEPEIQALKEIVFIGYGSTKKSDLTGSVVSISAEDLKKNPVVNIAESLTGRLAGVKVTSTEGSPDADINIRIRGGGSLTQDASPVLIVDGFPVNSISDISPSDIENVTVLKDASSTAIYGSRGANGVILITTKSGKDGGKINVSYNTFTGFKKIAKTVDVLGGGDYARWQYEFAVLKDDLNSFTSTLGNWEDIGQYDTAPTTNWQKEIYGRQGFVESHDLGIRGGSDKINYNFNYARYNENAIMLSSNYKRENVSLNLKSKPNDKIDLTLTMRYSNTEIGGGGANEQKEFSSQDARLRHAIGYAPIFVPGLTTDDTDEAVAGYLVNPFVAVADNDRTQFRRNFNMLGGASWKINKELQLKSDFGLDYYRFQDYRFYGRTTYYVNNAPTAENQGQPALIFSNRDNKRFRNANTLNYDFKKFLNSDHKLKVLLGQEMIVYTTNTLTNVIHGFPTFFNFSNAVNLTNQGTPQTTENFYSPDDKLLSFFGRINYDIKNKYLFTATYRADGSSIFLGDNRWGYFPSAAAAWKISEENLLKDVSWVNLLKIRLSYGQAGNNNIPPGQTIQTFQSTNTTWINNVTNYWSASQTLANPDLKWETTVTQNLGFDYELFDGRVSGSLETYKNVTKDLLILFPVSGTGYSNQYRNMGEVQNTGFEATLNLDAIKKSDYNLNFSFNIGFNKNRINSLGLMDDFGMDTNWASTAIGIDYMVKVGEPLGLMYGYQSNGGYEVSDFDYVGGAYVLKPEVANSSTVVGIVRPGSMKLKDIDGDGIVNANDLSVIGNANPLHTGGFVINGNVKNFDFSAAFNWSYGNDVYNASKIEHSTATISSPDGQFRNLTSVMADGVRWTNIDPST